MEAFVSKLAYSKMFLHLAKYPHLACNGVLLGYKQLVDEEPRERLVITDCVPLFHMSLSLAPGIEIALEQIDAYCEKSKTKLEIVGYYQANENANDNQWVPGLTEIVAKDSTSHAFSLSLFRPNLIALKFAEKLKEHCPHSLVFMIDNNLINPNKPGAQPFYKIYSLNNQSLIESKM